MTETADPQQFLAAATIDPAVAALRPDYRAGLLVVDGLDLGPGDGESDALMRDAEAHARALLADRPAEELPHIAAWRDAFRAFGAKPQRTRNSLEALVRRADGGLPRVNALTDIYNAVSVLHQIPLGGEDRSGYRGPARLIRATGEEEFDTAAGGEAVVEHPKPGEVVWADDAGVTCRRWNWRQGRRTALTENTRSAFFILDALEPVDDAALRAAVDQLAEALTRHSPGATTAARLVAAS